VIHLHAKPREEIASGSAIHYHGAYSAKSTRIKKTFATFARLGIIALVTSSNLLPTPLQLDSLRRPKIISHHVRTTSLRNR